MGVNSMFLLSKRLHSKYPQVGDGLDKRLSVFMDFVANSVPAPFTVVLARLMFWPTLMWNFALYNAGAFNWYDEVHKAPSGGRLILGAYPWPNSMMQKLILEERVSCFVNTVGEKSMYPPNSSYKQMYFPMVDFLHPKKDSVSRAVDYIDDQINAGHTVYVHCKAGKGRSGTVVMCWLVSKLGLSPVEAQKLLSAKRRQVLPNLYTREVVKEFAHSSRV